MFNVLFPERSQDLLHVILKPETSSDCIKYVWEICRGTDFNTARLTSTSILSLFVAVAIRVIKDVSVHAILLAGYMLIQRLCSNHICQNNWQNQPTIPTFCFCYL